MSTNGATDDARTALVTGCSSGFGLRIALELARRGHRVVATMRDRGRAEPLRAAADQAGVGIDVVTLDVDDRASVDAAVDEVVAAHGGIDVVVNNAGIEVRGPVELVSDAEARRQFETNVFGLLHVVRATVPHLRVADDGVLVNVSSIAGVVARPFGGIYAASKHAVEAISEALHFELGLFGVRVHAVEPGQFPTELGTNAVTAAAFADDRSVYRAVSDALDEQIAGLVPADQPPDPDDVAVAVADAVADPASPLRIPVGADTALILGVRQGNTFEDYEALMRTTLDYWEGYRRERPR